MRCSRQREGIVCRAEARPTKTRLARRWQVALLVGVGTGFKATKWPRDDI